MESTEKQLVARKGRISEELQQQAKKAESPVVSEFLVAARKGFTQHVLQSLTEGGSAQAAITDKHGRNCLQLACLSGHMETALAILQTKLVDINSANKRGVTALHDACTEGHTPIVLLLLALGANVSAMTKDGWTCLMCACSNGDTQLAQLLFAAGCDVNTFTKLGLTALHIAAWKGHTEVVEFLIHSGANLTAQAHNGKTALQLSQEENQHECATILTAAISKQSEQPMYRISALEGQLKMCQEKLVQAHRQQEELMKNERARHEERVANLKVEFGGKIEEASQTITSLRKRVAELDKTTSKSPPDIRIDTPIPPSQPSPATARKRKHKKKSRSPENLEVNSLIEEESKQRSASFADLSLIGKDQEDGVDGRRNGVASSLKLSPEIQRSSEVDVRLTTQRRLSNVEKSSITTLVEESLRNPSSIASIRKQLKSDGLTPKIQRKFPLKSNTPTTLPAMNPKETSPLTKESSKAN